MTLGSYGLLAQTHITVVMSLALAASIVTIPRNLPGHCLWQPPPSLSFATFIVIARGNLLRHCPSVATSVVTVRGNLHRHCPSVAPSSLTAILRDCRSKKTNVSRLSPSPQPLRFAVESPFLIGRMFVLEPSWKYSANLVGS